MQSIFNIASRARSISLSILIVLRALVTLALSNTLLFRVIWVTVVLVISLLGELLSLRCFMAASIVVRLVVLLA